MKSERNVMDLGSSSVRSAGSSPVSCTIFNINNLWIKIFNKNFLVISLFCLVLPYENQNNKKK